MKSFNKNPKTPYECFEYIMNSFFIFMEDENFKNGDENIFRSSETIKKSALKVLGIGKTIDIRETSEVDYSKIIEVFNSVEYEDVQNVLLGYSMVLEIVDRLFGEEMDEQTEKKIDQCEAVYLEVMSEFDDWEDPEKYKKTLRRICNNRIELSDTFIHDAIDHEEAEFGFELKNKALAARAKIKFVKADPASMDFVHEYFGLMDEGEKDFFTKEILRGFIERIFMDIEDNVLKEDDYEVYGTAKEILNELEL